MPPMSKTISEWEDAAAPTESGMYWVQYFNRFGGMDGRAEVIDIDPASEPGWANLAGGYAWTEAHRGMRPAPYDLYRWQRDGLRCRPTMTKDEVAYVKRRGKVRAVIMARIMGCQETSIYRIRQGKMVGT